MKSALRSPHSAIRPRLPGMYLRRVLAVACLAENEFFRGWLPELSTPREFTWRKSTIFLTAAGVERVIARLAREGKLNTAVDLREAWTEAQLDPEGAVAPAAQVGRCKSRKVQR